MTRPIVLATIVASAIVALSMDHAEAHKPVTSRYTFTEDVYPIVRARCGECHVSGGVAPMSLLTYDDARPWAESIRAELTQGHMPPWFADPGFAAVKNPHALSPRELDVLLTWATGGTPRGPADAQNAPAPGGSGRTGWRGGAPDLTIRSPSAFTLAADRGEATQEVVLQPPNDRDRWVAAVDVRPDNPAIVHDAVVFTRPRGAAADADGATAPARAEPDRVLAIWVPDSDVVRASNGIGFAWPAGDELVARVHYRKTWMYEGKPASDRSTVGVYFAKSAPMREVRAVLVNPQAALDDDVQALAVRTDGGPADVFARVVARLPTGAAVPLIQVATRPGWDQRYWLARPRQLPKGTRVESTAVGGSTMPPRVWLEFAVRATLRD